MYKATFVLLFLVISQSGFALLSPLAQSSVEIKAILDSHELSESIGAGEQIVKIEKTASGYAVDSTRSHLVVEVIPRPSHRIGPQQFDLKFGKVQTNND
jgi:hypothetical protein